MDLEQALGMKITASSDTALQISQALEMLIILQFSSKLTITAELKMKINVHKTIISPVMFYGYERGILTLRKQH
jgi:hypothetical protein